MYFSCPDIKSAGYSSVTSQGDGFQLDPESGTNILKKDRVVPTKLHNTVNSLRILTGYLILVLLI